MNFNLLTSALTQILHGLTTAQSHIAAPGRYMTALAVIEIVTAAMWWSLDGGNLSEPFKKLLNLTFWLWFASNFTGMANMFKESLVQLALGAGGQGSSEAILLDPSAFAGMALDATYPLVQSLEDAGLTHLVGALLLGTCYLVILACYFMIACHAALAVVEATLVITLAACLIPFGVSQHTRFLAEKAIGATVAVSVKLMVLAFILSVIKPVMSGIHFTSGAGSEILLNEALSMCLVCVLLAIIVWRAPSLASDLLAASPSLSAAHVGQHATSSTANAGAAYSWAAKSGAQGVAATKAAAGGIKRGAQRAGGAIQRLSTALRGGPATAGAATVAAAVTARDPAASSSPDKKRA